MSWPRLLFSKDGKVWKDNLLWRHQFVDQYPTYIDQYYAPREAILTDVERPLEINASYLRTEHQAGCYLCQPKKIYISMMQFEINVAYAHITDDNRRVHYKIYDIMEMKFETSGPFQ